MAILLTTFIQLQDKVLISVLKDIALFVKQINKYKSLGYKLNDQMMLEEFEMKRKLDNAAYSFGTFSLDGILSSNNKFVNFTTRKGLSLIEKNKYLKKLFVKVQQVRIFLNQFNEVGRFFHLKDQRYKTDTMLQARDPL